MIKTNPERKYKPALFHTSTAMWPITGLCLFQNNVYEDSTIRKRVCCMIQQALKHTEDVTYVFGDHMTFSFDWGTVWPRDTKQWLPLWVDDVSTVLSYCGIGCWKPGDIHHIKFYLFIRYMVFPNPLKSSVLSILFPHDQIIAVHKITMVIKEESLVVKLELNFFQFFEKLQSKRQNVS